MVWSKQPAGPQVKRPGTGVPVLTVTLRRMRALPGLGLPELGSEVTSRAVRWKRGVVAEHLSPPTLDLL